MAKSFGPDPEQLEIEEDQEFLGHNPIQKNESAPKTTKKKPCTSLTG